MTDKLTTAEIATARLRMRALTVADAAELQALTDDPAILGAVDILPEPFGLREARALVARTSDGRETFLGGRLVDCEALALVCGAHLLGEAEIEIGYWVGTAYQGMGLALEAAGAMVKVLRETLPHRRIVAECRRENEASWRLLHKLGFRSTGERGARPGRSRLVA